ncbi:MAG: hypothetical protein ACK59A_01745 [Cyanobacteriota bacterium]
MLTNVVVARGVARQGSGGRARLGFLPLLLLSCLAQGLPPSLAQGLQPAPGQASAPSQPAPGEPTKPIVGPTDEEFGDTPPPPPDLLVLMRKSSLKGRWRLGVFGRQQDPSQPDIWRLKLWEQTEDRVFVSVDVLNCSRAQPMRITGGRTTGGGQLMLRNLNPGGLITPANRLDHQIWWAACFPDQAGKDPATLAAEARRLGFSGNLPEREQVVPGPRRP